MNLGRQTLQKYIQNFSCHTGFNSIYIFLLYYYLLLCLNFFLFRLAHSPSPFPLMLTHRIANHCLTQPAETKKMLHIHNSFSLVVCFYFFLPLQQYCVFSFLLFYYLININFSSNLYKIHMFTLTIAHIISIYFCGSTTNYLFFSSSL